MQLFRQCGRNNFLAHKNMKPTLKVPHNWPKSLYSVLPTSQNHIFCSIKMSPYATSI